MSAVTISAGYGLRARSRPRGGPSSGCEPGRGRRASAVFVQLAQSVLAGNILLFRRGGEQHAELKSIIEPLGQVT